MCGNYCPNNKETNHIVVKCQHPKMCKNYNAVTKKNNNNGLIKK